MPPPLHLLSSSAVNCRVLTDPLTALTFVAYLLTRDRLLVLLVSLTKARALRQLPSKCLHVLTPFPIVVVPRAIPRVPLTLL